MTYKQKLIDLLKSDDEVKTAMEKLEFGTDLFYKNGEEGITKHETFIGMSHPYNGTSPQPIIKNHHNYCIIKDIDIEDIKRLYILTKPLQERFLRMYVLNKSNNDFDYVKEIYLNDLRFIIDNTRDFNQQDEEVYQKIYEALYNLTK